MGLGRVLFFLCAIVYGTNQAAELPSKWLDEYCKKHPTFLKVRNAVVTMFGAVVVIVGGIYLIKLMVDVSYH